MRMVCLFVLVTTLGMTTGWAQESHEGLRPDAAAQVVAEACTLSAVTYTPSDDPIDKAAGLIQALVVNLGETAFPLTENRLQMDGRTLAGHPDILWAKINPPTLPVGGAGLVTIKMRRDTNVPSTISLEFSPDLKVSMPVSRFGRNIELLGVRFNEEGTIAFAYFQNLDETHSIRLSLSEVWPTSSFVKKEPVNWQKINPRSIGIFRIPLATPISVGVQCAFIFEDENKTKFLWGTRRPAPFALGTEDNASPDLLARCSLNKEALGEPLIVCPTHRFKDEKTAIDTMVARWRERAGNPDRPLDYVHPCRVRIENGIEVFGAYADICRINASVGYLLVLQGGLPREALDYPVAELVRMARRKCPLNTLHTVVALTGLRKGVPWTDPMIFRETLFHCVAEGSQSILYRGLLRENMPPELFRTVVEANAQVDSLKSYLALSCAGLSSSTDHPDSSARTLMCGDADLLTVVFDDAVPEADPLLGFVHRAPVGNVEISVECPDDFIPSEVFDMMNDSQSIAFRFEPGIPEISNGIVKFTVKTLQDPRVYRICAKNPADVTAAP